VSLVKREAVASWWMGAGFAANRVKVGAAMGEGLEAIWEKKKRTEIVEAGME